MNKASTLKLSVTMTFVFTLSETLIAFEYFPLDMDYPVVYIFRHILTVVQFVIIKQYMTK